MQQWDTQRKAVLLDRVRDLIAERAERESEVPVVLQILAQTETWEGHSARERSQQAAFDAYWDEFWSVPETCDKCGLEGTRREISPLTGVPNSGRYCPVCAEIVRAAYQRNCVYCKKSYIASAVNKYAELCKDCWRKEWLGEAKRVAIQLRRAQEAELLAYLQARQHEKRKCPSEHWSIESSFSTIRT